MRMQWPIRVVGRIVLPAPTPPQMRVRVRRLQMPAASVLTAPALGQLRRSARLCGPPGEAGDFRLKSHQAASGVPS